MKIRTDFVTNSSSSSFCTVLITLKNGKRVYISGNSDYNQFFDDQTVNDYFLNLKTDNDLIKLLTWLGGLLEDEAVAKIMEIENVQNIESIVVNYEYTETDGDGDEKGTILYNAERNTVDISRSYRDDFEYEYEDSDEDWDEDFDDEEE